MSSRLSSIAGLRGFVTLRGIFNRASQGEFRDALSVAACDAILTFGFDADPWVSLSIIPDDGQDPRIDLLSYEFLTEAERREIEPNIDPEISQSGLA